MKHFSKPRGSLGTRDMTEKDLELRILEDLMKPKNVTQSSRPPTLPKSATKPKKAKKPAAETAPEVAASGDEDDDYLIDLKLQLGTEDFGVKAKQDYEAKEQKKLEKKQEADAKRPTSAVAPKKPVQKDHKQDDEILNVFEKEDGEVGGDRIRAAESDDAGEDDDG